MDLGSSEATGETRRIIVTLSNERVNAVEMKDDTDVIALRNAIKNIFDLNEPADKLMLRSPNANATPLKPRDILASVLMRDAETQKWEVYVELPPEEKDEEEAEVRLKILEHARVIRESVARESALGLFVDRASCGSEFESDTYKSEFYKKRLGITCWICGTSANLTLARILPGSHDMTNSRPDKTKCFAAANFPRFKNRYDFDSANNFMMLCGTRDSYGTCHYFYDHHKVAVVYNPFLRFYNLVWFISDKAALERVKGFTELKVHPSRTIQQRGFVFHAMKTLMENSDSSLGGSWSTEAEWELLIDDVLGLLRLSLALEVNISGASVEEEGEDEEESALSGRTSSSSEEETSLPASIGEQDEGKRGRKRTKYHNAIGADLALTLTTEQTLTLFFGA